ncbi:MAG: AAA family ATPase, partial [Okeania sp. SIO3H1]|nr:AAA family ATPase [Okeania sp. SIO3H1]
SLDKYESLDLETCLKIAIQLADILHKLYQNRVIHKDIKPANILIHPQTQQVKLIDFSIASVLPFETTEIQNPNLLEGTLAYISPEQTGRMNRGIDYRSDFYSLGVMFFEMLNRKLPFDTTDPMELIHCHLTKTPQMIDSQIPTPLVNIIHKLMAKNAEDRYQNALGLKYDLEKCLDRWEKVGKIETFKLGERDISDRFLIPEKLYGREAEVQQLLAAFVRVASPQEKRVASGKTELILVAGFSGIGKTVVVNEVHKPIVRQRGYFIKGKFDQFNRNIPFSALVQSLRDLMRQILSESDTQLQQWKDQILNAVGENGQVIIEVIPELEKIIGKQPVVTELSGSAAQNRFNLLFGKFIQVFTTKEHPLVIFLDDLQWADSASLNLIKLLMGEASNSYLLMIGAYRDNEVFPAHPLMLTLDEMGKAEATINTITLAPLSEININHLVADTLSCDREVAKPLTELVYQKTKGNPFFTTQFLLGLHGDELINFNFELGYWECYLTEVKQQAITDDVVKFMAGRLQKLPRETQDVLKLAACIGNQFDLETLAVVSEQSQMEVASSLWVALQEGLVLPKSETYKFFQGSNQEEKASVENISVGYKFLHDRVQQAAYSLISEELKQLTHLKVGRLLLKSIPESQIEEKIFAIVNQLNQGSEILETKNEKESLAQLNLIAGKKAKLSTAFATALEYGKMGIQLLSKKRWQEQYDLSLKLYQLSAEAAYSSGEFECAENLIQSAVSFAKTPLEKTRFYQIQMDIHVAQKNSAEAIAVGRKLLSSLGVELPKSIAPEEVQQEFSKLPALMPEGGTQALLALPTTTDPTVIAVMQTLVKLAVPIFTTSPELFPLLPINNIKQTLKYGTTSVSAVSYAHYSMLLHSIFNDLEASYQFGELALQLLPRFNNPAMDTHVWCIAAGSTHHWKIHLKQLLPFFQKGVEAGLESGDLNIAAQNYVHGSYMTYLLGTALPEAQQQIGIRTDAIRQLKQETFLSHCEIFRQCVLNLLNSSEDPGNLTGEALNEEELIANSQATQDTIGLFYLYSCKLQLYYLFNRYNLALTCANLAIANSAMAGSYAFIPVIQLYGALTRLALYPSLTDRERQEISIAIEKFQFWSSHGPMNFQHKYVLLKAEQHRVLGQKAEAIELYDRAIAGAKENEYIQEEALANELAAKFYLDWGKEKVAASYMQEAYYCYARWGAKAKINDLEQRYPSLLSSILERQKLSFLNSNTNATLTTGTISDTTTGTGEILDLATLMKASRTLSQDISLEGAIANLMQVVMENAGAENVALMLFQQQILMLTAILTSKGVCQVGPIPVEASYSIPLSIINQVKHNKKPLVIYNASNETVYAGDTYIQKHQPESVLCLPLLDRGQMIGILYLENNQVTGAFTSERVEILNLLCSQAAISLENALLYQQAQQAVADLQQAQLQLVQKEKMAALGDLMAGVAHEINNPLGFMGGNVSIIQDYLADVFAIIEYYQQELPYPSPEFTEKIEELELEFLMEDLPKTIASMETGIKRIGEISNSLRIFSRTDTETKSSLDLHDGLDSTLLILKYRLKANENRPGIETVKNYGDLPKVECYPGQLNQVFMNILANAIDALDEASEGKNYTEIEANNNCITISTKLSTDKNMAVVEIADNGPGMSEKVRSKIFEQGFTTKGVGKGTGLGMAIAWQIIVEKHSGTITCRSELEKGTEFMISLPLI